MLVEGRRLNAVSRRRSLPDTAFKQQRLKAWQPILTPKTVLPSLLLIGILFAPIGGLLVWGSGLVRRSRSRLPLVFTARAP